MLPTLWSIPLFIDPPSLVQHLRAHFPQVKLTLAIFQCFPIFHSNIIFRLFKNIVLFFTITINICISFSYKNYIHHILVFHECIAINLNFYIFTIKIFFLQVLITLHKVFFSPINSLFEKNSYFENFYKKMCVYRTNSSDTDTLASFSN